MQYNPNNGKRSLDQSSKTSYKTFLLLTKASKTSHPTQNLLITNFKHQSKSLISKKASRQRKPIHSPSCEEKISRLKSAKNSDFPSELPLTQRMNSLRVNRCNQFNRRSFQSISSQKNSLYGKTIRKCKSVLMKFEIQSLVQNMVAKKQLTDKSKNLKEQLQFLDQFKTNLIEGQVISSGTNMKKIIIVKSPTPLKTYKMSLNQPNVKQKQKYKNIFKNMHFRLKRVLEEDSDLRPWGETRRIITELTYNSEEKANL